MKGRIQSRANKALLRSSSIKVAHSGTIGKAVEDYTGWPLVDLDVVPDPVVPGVYAVHAVYGRTKRFTGHFLIKGVPLNRVTAQDLEEVQFTHWPPTSTTHTLR